MIQKWQLRLIVLFTAIAVCVGGRTSEAAIRLFSPQKDYTQEARYYTITTAEPIQNALLVFVEDSDGNILYEKVPMLIEGGIFAITSSLVTLPREGQYRFQFATTPSSDLASGKETVFSSFIVSSSRAPSVLKDFTLSKAPYYVGQSLEVVASFTQPPLSVEAHIMHNNTAYKVDITHNQGGVEVVGYATPQNRGDHYLSLSFVDPATQTRHQELIPIYVDTYDRGESAVSSGGGGGCNSGLGGVCWLLCVGLPLLYVVRKQRSGKSLLFLFLLIIVLGFFCGTRATAATYTVTNAGDDTDTPPRGSLRSIMNTITLLGSQNDVIQFIPTINEIELKGAIHAVNGVRFDAYSGRQGKRVTLTLASGGYRHIIATDGFSAKGITLKGFSKGDLRNIIGNEQQNGGLHYSASDGNRGCVLENCTFIDIIGDDSAVVFEFYGITAGSAPAPKNLPSLRMASTMNVTVENCLFSKNTSESSAGAIRIIQGSAVLRDTFIGYNRAQAYGGALLSSAWAPYPSIHNTIVGNRIEESWTGRIAPQRVDVKEDSHKGTGETGIVRGGTSALRRAGLPGYPGQVELSRCNLVENETKQSGGALQANILVLVNAVVFANSAGIGEPAIGGGLLPEFYATLWQVTM